MYGLIAVSNVSIVDESTLSDLGRFLLNSSRVDNVLSDDRRGPIVNVGVQKFGSLATLSGNMSQLRSIVALHALKAERLSPGCFHVTVETIAEKLLLPSTVGDSVHRSKSFLGQPGIVSQRCTSQDVKSIIDANCSRVSELVKNVVMIALDLAGFGGRIVVEKSSNTNTTVELVTGYSFTHRPLWESNIRLEHPRVICIDGFIDSASEAHRLLEGAAADKKPTLLFVRGMADDVKHTIKVNNDRGSLFVIPIIVPFDLEGINTLNDVSISTGAPIVSSNLGHVIGNVTVSDSSVVDSAVVSGTTVSIVCGSTIRNVSSHLSFLRRKREDVSIDDVGELLDKRIRSLSARHVVIRLVDDHAFVVAVDCIDKTLREIRSLVDYGKAPDQVQIVPGTRHAVVNKVSDDCVLMLRSVGVITSGDHDRQEQQ